MLHQIHHLVLVVPVTLTTVLNTLVLNTVADKQRMNSTVFFMFAFVADLIKTKQTHKQQKTGKKK